MAKGGFLDDFPVPTKWLALKDFRVFTPPTTTTDTQNDGLEKVTPFKHGNCLVSMFDFFVI